MKNFFKGAAFLTFFGHIAAKIMFGSYFPNFLLGIALMCAIVSIFLEMFTKAETKAQAKQQKQKKTSEDQRVNQLVNDFFSSNETYPLGNGMYLTRTNVNSFDGLDVVVNGETICKMGEFHKFNEQTYEAIKIRFKNGVGGSVVTNTDYTKKEEEPVSTTTANTKTELEMNIEEIQKHMDHIQNKDITDGLSRTSVMLQSINTMVKKTPSKANKLDKLQSFYLPSLLTILNNYDYLYSTNKEDPEIPTVETKLVGTLDLINEALASIRDSMNDAEILDINADMSVIESMLQQDGLVKKGSIDELK